jgi:pyridoxal phosphate enzyme (YggS family)
MLTMGARDELSERYRQIMDRVGEAAERSGRRAADVIAVAVTKTAGPEQVRQIIELGHQDLGENRVQQLLQRTATIDEFLSRKRRMAGGANALPEHVRWHMIGHLQRNKVKKVLPVVKLIHSVDSLRLAEELHNQAAKDEAEAEILLQINASGEASKFGLAPAAAMPLAEQIDTMLNVKLRGLMSIAPYTDDPETNRPWFERTAELFAEMQKCDACGPQFNILSMGMSDDFEVAIECGANIVRIGRGFFGEGASED